MKPVILISDLHGTLDALLLPLEKEGAIEWHRNGGRKYPLWTASDEKPWLVFVAGDITNRTRSDNAPTDANELAFEELLIVIVIFYLNNVVEGGKIEVTLGNHELNNFLALRTSASILAHKCYASYYENTDGRSPRTILFTKVNNFKFEEKCEIAKRLVEEGVWPRKRLFFRDFYGGKKVRYDCIKTHRLEDNRLLVVFHAGPATKRLRDEMNKDVEKFAIKMNRLSNKMVRTFKFNEDVNEIVTSREWAGVLDKHFCSQLPSGTIFVLGHTTPAKNKEKTCDNHVLRIDLGSNRYSQKQCNIKLPCEFVIRYVTLQAEKVKTRTAKGSLLKSKYDGRFGSHYLCSFEATAALI